LESGQLEHPDERIICKYVEVVNQIKMSLNVSEDGVQKNMTITLDTGQRLVYRFLSPYRDGCDPWVKLMDSEHLIKSIRC
jgi:hypothetical protein